MRQWINHLRDFSESFEVGRRVFLLGLGLGLEGSVYGARLSLRVRRGVLWTSARVGVGRAWVVAVWGDGAEVQPLDVAAGGGEVGHGLCGLLEDYGGHNKASGTLGGKTRKEKRGKAAGRGRRRTKRRREKDIRLVC